MGLAAGTRLGSYEILSALGSGGMGEVYRARDSKLNRDVAIKVLPDGFSADPNRLARFHREARVLASLNHPNIAAIYGFEEPSGGCALVLELVEGPTLADRIATGRLPMAETLAIARQIVEALDAAHEQGIIHRDLKPANIKLRPDGTVKVLDFGLAKAIEPVSGLSGGGTVSPTITSPAMTEMGVILGTAAYMSPEQAKGRPADTRSDVWAFGCVLYEMLAGTRPFDGEDITETIAAVVTRDPDWTRLPPATPESIRRLLRRCLTRPVQQRLRSIGDAALEIADATQAASAPTGDRAQVRPERSPAASWSRAAVAVLILLVVAAAAWIAGRRQGTTPPASTGVVRLSLVPAAADAIAVSGNDRDLAIALDGRRIAYVAGNGTSLVVRDLDRSDAIRIDGAGLPHNPFFSPDGAWVGFVDGLSAIKKVSARGGPIETVCRITTPGVAASWHGDTIVFAQYGRIYRVPATGGTAEAVTPPAGPRQAALFNPTFLPEPNLVLVGSFMWDGAQSGIGIVDLRTGTEKPIMAAGSTAPGMANGMVARFVPPNHLIYRPGIEPGGQTAPALRALQFDVNRLETVGSPFVVDEPVFITPFGGYPVFDIAENGTLVYVSRAAQPNVRRLVWVSRDGAQEPIDLPARAYVYPNVSPSGRHVAFDIRDQENDTWIWDLGRTTLRRLTFDPEFDQYAVWTHDERHVAHIQGPRIFWQAPDGSGPTEQLATRQGVLALYAFSKDDRQLVFREDSPETGHDLMMLSLDTRTVAPLLQTRFNELNAEISPDGRWLAYESDESGPHQIHVRPFPDVNAGRWQVSTAGGRAPQWSRDGKELFFLALDGAMMAARVETTTAFVNDAPRRLFEHRNYVGGASSIGRTYDVAPDGRFLVIKPAPPPEIAVVLNWQEELKPRVPTR